MLATEISQEPGNDRRRTGGIPPALAEIAPDYSPEFIEELLPWIEPLYKHYFTCEVRHLERMAASPVFLVGNHNGLGWVEIPLLCYAWYKYFGYERPILGLAHQMVFRTPFVSEFLPRIGAVPASPDAAHRVLGSGNDLLVFPGGDWEACRPTSARGLIDFGGRKGFVRVALETGAPINPLVICGAHETAIIASRGEEFARALGIDKLWRTKTLPLVLVPPVLPSKITMEVLEPIYLRDELAGIEGEEEKLAAGYTLVTGRMQKALTRLYSERRGFWE